MAPTAPPWHRRAMDPGLVATVLDNLPRMLLLVAFQAIVGLIGFRTYRLAAHGRGPAEARGGGPFPLPREPWPKAVTALALVQYTLVTVGSAAVFGAIFPSKGGLLVLLWIALIVYFSLAGMMIAVMFPATLARAAGVVATPLVLGLLLHVSRAEPLALSLGTELVFVGIFYGTALPAMLVVAFVRVGGREVLGSPGMLLVNLAIILPLAAIPVFVWRDVVPATIGQGPAQAPLAWVSVVASAAVMVGQLYLAWRTRVRPLVEAGAV